jgi:RimJ/RimL family protein N-acetyltransferase
MTMWRHVETEADIDRVLELRNQGRVWFGAVAPITREQHHSWWAEQRPLCILVGEPAVGYGMLRRREERLWVALVVDEDSRGQGIGTEIYKLLVELVTEPIYAAIHIDNGASGRAAIKAGFVPDPFVAPPDIKNVDDWIVLKGPS